MTNNRISCLTPPGSGAIAVVAVCGPLAWSMVRDLFRPASGKTLPDRPEECATWLGRIGPGPGDEVILAIPTTEPEPAVEIHCHGGRQVVRMIVGLFIEKGCCETSTEVECNGSLLPYARGALKLLPEAKTLRTASILLDQAQGAFDCALSNMQQLLTANQMAEAVALAERIRSLADVGRHLAEPWRIAIAGAPNAGKSSLLNALAGYQRSIVAPVAGTTRDIVIATLAFDGWLMELSDTAGLREGSNDLEEQGIELARQQILASDLCLWVLDVSAPRPCWRPSAKLVMPVLNKIDQPVAWDIGELNEGIRVSTLTGEGLDSLIQALVAKLVPVAPVPGEAVPLADDWIADLEAILAGAF